MGVGRCISRGRRGRCSFRQFEGGRREIEESFVLGRLIWVFCSFDDAVSTDAVLVPWMNQNVDFQFLTNDISLVLVS